MHQCFDERECTPDPIERNASQSKMRGHVDQVQPLRRQFSISFDKRHVRPQLSQQLQALLRLGEIVAIETPEIPILLEVPQRVWHDNVLVDAHQVHENVGVVAHDVDVKPQDPAVIRSQRARDEVVACARDERSADRLAFEAVSDFGSEVEVKVALEDLNRVVAL